MLFRGVGTALITPMTETGAINYRRLEELIDWQIEQGVDAIVLCGTTGEAPTISDDEKKQMFAVGIQAADRRVPVIVGTGTNDTAHTLLLDDIAAEAGADGLLISNPYYNKSSDEGIYAHFQKISDNTALPIIVYNVPSRTGKNLSASLMLKLCGIEHITGFKEASGDISQITELCAKKHDDISVYSGNDEQALALMAVGGDGVICTSSNIAPKLCCEITDAFFAGDLSGARKKQYELLDLHNALFCDANPIPLKTAMNAVGLQAGPMRLPLTDLGGEKLEYLKKVLAAYGYTLS